jgi:hypothetical protein
LTAYCNQAITGAIGLISQSFICRVHVGKTELPFRWLLVYLDNHKSQVNPTTHLLQVGSIHDTATARPYMGDIQKIYATKPALRFVPGTLIAYLVLMEIYRQT